MDTTKNVAAQAFGDGQYRTLAALAATLGKHYRTIHRAAQAGKIKTRYFGSSRLIPPDEWRRILEHGWR